MPRSETDVRKVLPFAIPRVQLGPARPLLVIFLVSLREAGRLKMPEKTALSQTTNHRPHRHGISDQEIVEQAQAILNASGYPQLRSVQVHSDHGRVTLQGRLATYYLKQLAQSLVLSVDGIRDLDNDVKVLGCR